MIGYVILGILLAFIAIILVRALLYKPFEEPDKFVDEINVDREKIITDMVEMIRCKTVSYYNSEKIDWNEFWKFQQLLHDRYPQIHKKCTLEKIGKTGLLYHLKG